VGSIVKPTNEVVLPKTYHWILVLAIKTRLGSKNGYCFLKFFGTDGSLGLRWSPFTTYFKFLDLLDDIIDRCRACRVALIVTPWDVSVGHVVGEGPLDGFQI